MSGAVYADVKTEKMKEEASVLGARHNKTQERIWLALGETPAGDVIPVGLPVRLVSVSDKNRRPRRLKTHNANA